MHLFKGKNITVYVTGGIAVYKVCSLVRSLIKKGSHVRVAMTEAATQFVTPLTFQILTKSEVHVDTFAENTPKDVAHIELADWSDLAIIAPATANTLSKLSLGIADNFVSSALLATTCPVFVIPAMNENMWEHPATQSNIESLRGYGYHVMEPAYGFLAEGYEGKGRFPEEVDILGELEYFLHHKIPNLPLNAKKIIVTAGGTTEAIDPVRYITNRSSGKMGHAIAESAYAHGAEVTLITASKLSVRQGIEVIRVQSAKEMYQQVKENFKDADGLIMAAAVSDYAPEKTYQNKIKKAEQYADLITLSLKKNPDILKEVSLNKAADQWTVGFAAETEDLEKYAQKKLQEKNLNMIVANDVGQNDRGFDSEKNAGLIYLADSKSYELPLMSKQEMADQIIKILISDVI